MPGMPTTRQYRLIVNGSPVIALGTGGEWLDQYPEERWKEVASASELRGGVVATLESRTILADTEENRQLFPDATKVPGGCFRGPLLLTRPVLIASIES